MIRGLTVRQLHAQLSSMIEKDTASMDRVVTFATNVDSRHPSIFVLPQEFDSEKDARLTVGEATFSSFGNSTINNTPTLCLTGKFVGNGVLFTGNNDHESDGN